MDLDSTTFYFKYRTVYQADTSEWSEIDSMETILRLDLSYFSACREEFIEVSFGAYAGLQFDYTTHYRIYADSLKSELILDTTVNRSSRVGLELQSCRPIFIETQCSNDDLILTSFDKYDVCGTNELLTQPFYKPDSFYVRLDACSDSFQLKFDTSDLFQSSLCFSFLGGVLSSQYAATVPTPFDKDPINYYYKYRVKNGGYWSEWQYKGKVFQPQHQFIYSESQINYKGTMYLSLSEKKDYSNTYTYLKEYYLDTSENFDSPKLHVCTMPISEGFYRPNRKILFGEKNYIKYRIISSAGKSQFSNVLVKYTTDKPQIIVNPSNEYYPYSLPSLRDFPNMESPNIEYEFNEDGNFPKKSTLMFNNGDVPVGLYNDKTYYVRARMISAIDTSDWSDIATFNTENFAFVQNPFLILPEDSANFNSNVSVKFTWETRAGDLANMYYIYLFEDSITRYSASYINRVDDIQEIVVSNLKPNKTYYWTVRSVGEAKNSEPLEYRQFSTSTTAGISQISIEKISLFPNPTSSGFGVRGINPSDIKEVSIYSTTGQLIQKSERPGQLIFELQCQDSGTYFVKIRTVSGRLYSMPIQLVSE